MRVLVIDDEPHARAKLRRMLESFRDVNVVGEAADGVEALRQCICHNPDAIFLDMQMPELDGFGVVSRLPRPRPSVVMVTAYEEHALNAFDAEVRDYLLKPVAIDRLERTISRLQTPLTSRLSRPGGLSRVVPRPGDVICTTNSARLLASARGKTEVVAHSDIDWLESADNYVHVHEAHKSYLVRCAFGDLLEELGSSFVRVHRCFAISLGRVVAVHARAKGDAVITLKNGRDIPCSRQYKPNLLLRLRGSTHS